MLTVIKMLVYIQQFVPMPLYYRGKSEITLFYFPRIIAFGDLVIGMSCDLNLMGANIGRMKPMTLKLTLVTS